MKRLTFNLAASGTLYVPVPFRCVLTGAYAAWQGVVTTANIITISRGATTVNLITAATTAGLVRETGVPDATSKDLVFDPDHATTTYGVIKLVQSGGNAIAAVVTLELDEYAHVAQPASEA